jgi:hypothetical protein
LPVRRLTDRDFIIDISNELSLLDIIEESRKWGPGFGVMRYGATMHDLPVRRLTGRDFIIDYQMSSPRATSLRKVGSGALVSAYQSRNLRVNQRDQGQSPSV